jgi:ribosomal protein S12 methylthiotransferase accessory factor
MERARDRLLGLGGTFTVSAEYVRVVCADDEEGIEISGPALPRARSILRAAARPSRRADLVRAAGTAASGDATTIIDELIGAGALIELVPAAERVEVTGEDDLAAAIRTLITSRYWPSAAGPLTIACLGDLGGHDWHTRAQGAKNRSHDTILACATDADGAWIGPSFGTIPCPVCLRLRRMAVEPLDDHHAVVFPADVVEVVAQDTVQWAQWFAMGRIRPDDVLRVRGRHRRSHTLLPAPACPGCAPPRARALPVDAPLAAQAAATAAHYRALWVRAEGQEPDPSRFEPFLDPELGPFVIESYHAGDLYRDLPLVLGGFRLLQPLDTGFRRLSTTHGTFGTGTSLERRRLVAFAEAVERSALFTQVPDLRGVSAAGVSPYGLDPKRVAPFLPEQFQRAGFPFRPYAGQPIDWTWTFDVASHSPVLVPHDALAAGRPEELDAFRLMNDPFSSGAAAHVTMRQAVLRALLELIERDAFMLTWYLRLPVDELMLDEVALRDDEALELRSYLGQRGIALRVFDLAVDFDVPTVLIIATAADRRGQWRAGGSILAAAAGASEPDALRRGLTEIIGHYSALACVSPDEDSSLDPATGRPWTWWPMFERYLRSGQESAFAFLGSRKRVLGQATRPVAAADLLLAGLIEQFRARDMPVLVRATGQEWIDRSGLVAVKVFVPGMIPLTDHEQRVPFGAPRFASVQSKWGCSGVVNPDPHPIA